MIELDSKLNFEFLGNTNANSSIEKEFFLLFHALMNNFCLVIIDDDPLSILISKRLLIKHLPSQLKYELVTFTDAFEGLRFISDSKSNEKLHREELILFLDINMPLLTGWELIQKLEKESPHHRAKIYMYSSSLDLNDRERFNQFENVYGFIDKPLSKEKIEEIFSGNEEG